MVAFSIEVLAGLRGDDSETVPLEFDVRRLVSNFVRGWNDIGLLLIRLAAGGCVVVSALARLDSGQSLAPAALDLIAIGDGILLIVGMWTPAAGALMAILSVWSCLAHQIRIEAGLLLAVLGIALAFLGPGAWSLDARMFGWGKFDV